MSTKTEGAAAANTAAKDAPPADPTVVVKVLVNGALIDGLHHAKGKQMPLPKSKAETAASLKPPLVEIIGV